MFKLGVTGGIGSGKSTVCRMLEQRGARVFDADRAARQIMENHPEVRDELVAAFGDASFDDLGRLDRSYLADRVFKDARELEILNGIVHPRVYEAFERSRTEAEREGIVLLVHEAALIFESGGDKLLDAVAVVHAPEPTRIARTTARDGSTPQQVRARMQHQLPADELLRRADFVIHNDGSLEDLESQVDELFVTVTRKVR